MLLADFRRGLPEHRAQALLRRLNMPHERDLGGPAATVEGLAGLACMNGLGVEIACDGASEPPPSTPQSDQPTDMSRLGCERVATTGEAGGLGGMKGRASPEFAPHLGQDDPIHGLRLDIGDPRAGDWRSELVRDIDHIVARACGTDGRGHFRGGPGDADLP